LKSAAWTIVAEYEAKKEINTTVYPAVEYTGSVNTLYYGMYRISLIFGLDEVGTLIDNSGDVVPQSKPIVRLILVEWQVSCEPSISKIHR